MALLGGAVVPHAPVIGLDPTLAGIRGARTEVLESLALLQPQLVVVLSPHGARTGVYRSATGSFAGFGVRGHSVTVPQDRSARAALGEEWNAPHLDEALDHGVVGALLDETPRAPAVACTFAETTGPHPAGTVDEVIAAARALMPPLRRLAEKEDLVVIASAHGAGALTPRAPMGERPDAIHFEERLLDALRSDVGAVAEIAAERWASAYSCGAGPLTAFGALFAGRPLQVVLHEAPFGVGYIVGAITRSTGA